jgi:uncharacterized protein
MSDKPKRNYLRSPEAAAAAPVAPRETSPAPPESPCVGVCTPGDDDFCLGCFRSLEEIARWTLMSPAEQWDVVEQLPLRDPLNQS